MGLFGPKKIVLKKYASGTVRDITEVNDPVFNQKMMGDGLCIEPDEEMTNVTAPIEGTVTMVFDTKHAVGIKNKQGIECLIHYGLDTVNLKGKGFDVKVKVGDKVKFNDRIMNVDNSVIKEAGYATPVIVVFTDLNGYTIKKNFESDDLIEFIK